MTTNRKQGGRKSQFFYYIDGIRYDSPAEAAQAHNVSVVSVHKWCKGGKQGCWREPKGASVTKLDAVRPKVPTELYDAMGYLEAIVSGVEPPDAIRVQAAKSLLAYQLPKIRVPKESPAPRELHRKEQANNEANLLLDFERKAAKIKKRHAERLRKDGATV